MTFRYVIEPQVGFAHARNRAIAEATTEWVAFFDDDQIAASGWLAALWEAAQRNRCDCVGGAVQLEFDENQAWTPGPRCQQLLGARAETEERSFAGAFQPGAGNLLIRRALLSEVHGFDTAYPGRGEDTRIFRKLEDAGHTCWFSPDAKVKHVIEAERNQPAAYRVLAKECAEAGDLSQAKWGVWLPVVGLTRLCRVCFLGIPTLGLVSVFGSPAKRLDTQCMVIMEFWRSISELRHSFSPRRMSDAQN